jgi:hypothetical protein
MGWMRARTMSLQILTLPGATYLKARLELSTTIHFAIDNKAEPDFYWLSLSP